MNAGLRLRSLREQLGLTIRDVQDASELIAKKYGIEDFAVPIGRLSDVESKGVVPSIYRLYSLSVIYRIDIRDLMAWYGIDLNETAVDMAVSQPRKSHLTTLGKSQLSVNVPVRIDPGFDPRRTTNIGRMIEKWGLVPLSFLQQHCNHEFTYGYIGSEDFTMHPLLLPGSFIQVDEAANTVTEGNWRSEYERPIYFLELRDGYTACWCSMKGDYLILQPHPLSAVPVRVLRHSQEAEILGQVVGVAMRLNGWSPVNGVPARGEAIATPRRLN